MKEKVKRNLRELGRLEQWWRDIIYDVERNFVLRDIAIKQTRAITDKLVAYVKTTNEMNPLDTSAYDMTVSILDDLFIVIYKLNADSDLMIEKAKRIRNVKERKSDFLYEKMFSRKFMEDEGEKKDEGKL